MNTTPIPFLRLARLAWLGALVSIASARQDPAAREAMWWAPTAEDWAKPCLIPWQRTWEDALEVARATGKPLLVATNMDGEIASEHYAGVRYRDPEIAKLYEPYVPVIASVYRHNPRDHDESGNRILCPRFGSVTCGEHIWIEPILFEQFFEGRRVAPRHIMVELDGSEVYDVFYAFDTASVFRAIEDGIADRASRPEPQVRGDRSIVERVASHDNADRRAVEEAYRAGDPAQRRALLEAAVAAGDAASLDLLRLALYGFDPDLARLARQALANASSAGAVDLVAEALRVPLEGGEREALIATLERLGASSPRARTLAVVHRGLAASSGALDVEGWSEALAGSAGEGARPDQEELLARLEEAARRAEDAATRLDFAESTLEYAIDPRTALSLGRDARTASKYARLMFEDAQRAAREAEGLGASGWRVDAVLALSAYYLGEGSEAHARAEAAARALPSGAEQWTAMAALALFAEARQAAISQAVREKREWPAEWLADVHGAYSVLARHPLGSDAQVAAHHDFLRSLGALGQAARALDEGFARFPDSPLLHARLRERILAEQGVDGLARAYGDLLARPEAAPSWVWYAGYAALVVAEFHRRTGANEPAVAAYGRALALYEQALERSPEDRASCDHYVAMAHAGLARLALDRKDEDACLAELLLAFERSPSSAAVLDGINLSAVATARTLLARARAQQRNDIVERLTAALAALEREQLELPAFERER